MLDAFIIEEIRRRERADDQVRPQLERPDRMPWPQRRDEDDTAPPARGSVIIDHDDDDDTNGLVVIDM
jgi:hypothetical protein